MAKEAVWSMAFILCIAMAARSEKEINMVFYMHDVVAGSNRTAAQVGAGSSIKPGFGAMVVIDDALTRTPSPDSTLVGRAQGMYLSDSLAILTSPDSLLAFTAILEWPGEYSGSTLSIQGGNRMFMDQREVSVVGGTGKFRFALGYATVHNVSTALQFNVTVRVP
uniref:Dirigent protein n=1 Tax=Picea sitchensis TaxID=3332 RepID=A6YR06_PICSI|nr:unknown [Picea sitchensis]ABR27726.1 dirigent-like protein [Picea sitchensis]